MTKPYIKSLNIMLLLVFAPVLLKSQTNDSLSADSIIISKPREEKVIKQEEEIVKMAGITPEIVSEFQNFSNLHISYYGTTQNCKPFNIYCFKYRYTWFLIANQEMNITFFTLRPPRVESSKIITGSNFLLHGLGKAYSNQYTKLKKRRKVVKDLEIYGFYKFNRPGKKSIKGLLYLEFPEVETGPPWPFKWLAGKAEEKAVEKANQAKGIIPEINTDVLEPAKEVVPE